MNKMCDLKRFRRFFSSESCDFIIVHEASKIIALTLIRHGLKDASHA